VNDARVMRLERPPRPGLPLPYAVAVVLVCAAAVAVLWGLPTSPKVTADGVSRTVVPGSTIGDLVRQRYLLSKPGALLAVTGGVLRITGGDPVTFARNGAPADETQRLYDGDVVTSASGADAKEGVTTVRVSIPPTITVQGAGPILKLMQQGRPETDEIRRGAVSGAVLSSRTVVVSLPTVMVASPPSRSGKLVALTFDDGPWPGQTDKILGILKAEQVHATFFMLGEQATRYPGLAARVAAQGSQVGNHTIDHKDLTQLSARDVRHEIVEGAAQIKAASRVDPTVLRPAFGHVNRTVQRQANAAQQTIVLWNVDTQDWTRPGADKILENAKREMVDDAVVLLHDGGGDQTQTVQALPALISWLKLNDYKFVTIKEMESAR
jgi:peptidoglycan/xylan/chitin deacetylase (PgdA/CDA1 family)